MIAQSHFDAFVNQERPTLAALPAPASFNLAPIAPNCQPQKYASPDFVNQIRPTLAALPAPAGFELTYIGKPAQPQKYAKSDFVNQVRPTLAALPSPAGFELAFVAKQALPQRYTQAIDFVNQLRPTLATLPSSAGLNLAFSPRPCLPLWYTEADFVIGAIQPTLTLASLASWLGSVGWKPEPNNYIAADSSTQLGVGVVPSPASRIDTSQVRLGGAIPVPRAFAASPLIVSAATQQTPTFVLTNDAARALALTYSEAEAAAALAPILGKLPGYVDLPLSSARALAQAYARADFSAQLNPTLATLPTFVELALTAQRAWTPTYSFPNIVLVSNLSTVASVAARPDYSQVRLGGVGPVPRSLAANAFINPVAAATPASVFGQWLITEGAVKQALDYAAGGTAAPENLITAVASTFAQWLITDGKAAVDFTFAVGDAQAPDKLAGTTPAPVTLAQWLTTDGKSAVLYWHAPSTLAAPDIAIPSASVFGRIDYSQVRLGGVPKVPKHLLTATAPIVPTPPAVVPLGVAFETTDGQKAVTLVYVQPSVVAPDKANLITIATTFLPGWMSTDGKTAQPLRYAASATNAPDKANLITAAVAFLPGWLTTDGKTAVQYVFARGDWSAPVLMVAAVVVVPVFAWRGEDPYVPKWDWYAMGDTYSGPATTAAAQQSYASANMAATAVPSRFQSAAPTWSGPVQPIVTAPLPLFASGLADTASVSLPLRYIKGGVEGPDKFAQVTAAQTFLPGWLTTDGAMAVLLRYIKGDTYTSPDKANQVVAAPTFLPGWMATIGAMAVTLRYAPVDVVNQVRATLATLATLLSGIADPGANAQPQKFAASGTTAPEKNIPTPPTVTGWTATPGLSAVQLRYAQAEAFVAQIAPTLATLPLTVAGIAEPGVQKLVLRYWQPDAWISTPMNLPFVGGNPVGLLAGKTIPLIGVLTGKVINAIGITTGKILQAVGITSGKVIS